jgi:tetratricopeptide (TPR) repeat protein
MISERIKILEQFIVDDPNDPFNHYALALELLKSDKETAKKIFDMLIAEQPNYVPTYYQAALLYFELSLNDQAVKIIEQGIAESKRQSNQKAASELRALLVDMD